MTGELNLNWTSMDCKGIMGTSVPTDAYIQLQTWNCSLALWPWDAEVPNTGRGQLYFCSSYGQPLCIRHLLVITPAWNLTWGARYCLQETRAAFFPEELTVIAVKVTQLLSFWKPTSFTSLQCGPTGGFSASSASGEASVWPTPSSGLASNKIPL